jgi:putative NIF3 family GTP cyclohydrolase 1 type 2
MKAKAIVEHFLSRADWVDRSKTVDRVIVGDPEKDADRCLVAWMPAFDILRRMVDRGISLLICHEPTFWNHLDERPTEDRIGKDKLQFILDHNLVIIRNHDCWDRWPQLGMPWAWARFLGFDKAPVRTGYNGYQHRYDMAPMPFDDFARKVADRCGRIREGVVQVVGDGQKPVSRIGVGTGCACIINVYQEMGCDCSIVCDDGSCSWSGIQKAEEMEHPVIRVNHGTSEEPGIVTLTQYINENLKGLHAEHVPQGNIFRQIGSAKG